MKNLLLLLFFSSNFALAQLDIIQRFPLQDSTESINYSLILNAPNGDLLYFFLENNLLYYSRSNDKGLSWNEKMLIDELYASTYNSEWNKFVGVVTKSSKIIIIYKRPDYNSYLIYSDNNGLSWSIPNQILPSYILSFPQITELNDSTLWYLFSHGGDLKYTESKDNGESWSEKTLIWEDIWGGSLASIDDSTKIIICYDYRKRSLIKITSFDNGLTWTKSDTLFNKLNLSYNNLSSINLEKQNDSTYVLTFQREFEANNIRISDILISKSFNKGETWSDPEAITNYIGENINPETTLVEDEIYFTFSSDRYEKTQAWYGVIDKSIDLNSPPNIYSILTDPLIPLAGSDVTIKAVVIDDNFIENVNLNYSFDDGEIHTLEMFDDGMHNDGNANDNVYANSIQGINNINNTFFSVSAIDNDDLFVKSFPDTIKYSNNNLVETYYFDINNIKLPINNKGIIADVRINNKSGARFDGLGFLYSSGFALSGYSNGKIWSNGVMTASRTEDYVSGTVNNILDSNYYKIYLLNANALPFNDSWNKWKFAVELGAKFYDGNGDGIYNPVDLNGNGDWDTNEDKPYIIGDITAWCVLNDGKPNSDRNFSNVTPQGIEVKQTVFAYSSQTYPELANVIFIKYNLENKGTVADVLDSVYFSAWSDPDLGQYHDDLIGSDTTINSGYLYNSGNDDDYGINPPIFCTTLLQGPPSYMPGITYIDNNQNNIFELGIDTPIDTAKILSGKLLGETYLPGAINQKMTSVIHYMSSHPTQGDADDEFQMRNYLLGKRQNGGTLNPCNWEFGQVLNIDCDDVNPKFMYSGDPVIQFGWLNTNPTDQRLMVNTGPFILEKDKPIEIIIAYIVGRGTDALNSITVAKDIAKDVIGFYNTNFSYIPVGIKDTKTEIIPTKFVLEQNYPNPFNPTTTIKYSIPPPLNPPFAKGGNAGGGITLKVYDILGREVATLVNKQQKPGNYKVTFNAGLLASGIYYYQLKTGSFIQTKKMLLLK